MDGRWSQGQTVPAGSSSSSSCTTCGSPTGDVSDPEVYVEEPLVSSRSTSTTPTPWSSSPLPSSSSFKAGSKGPQVKGSSFKTALSALAKLGEESKEFHGWVKLILAEAKKTSSDKHMWGGWLATMVPKLHDDVMRCRYDSSSSSPLCSYLLLTSSSSISSSRSISSSSIHSSSSSICSRSINSSSIHSSSSSIRRSSFSISKDLQSSLHIQFLVQHQPLWVPAKLSLHMPRALITVQTWVSWQI